MSWRTVNVRADNDGTYPGLMMNFTADYVVLFNPETETTKTVFSDLNQSCFIHNPTPTKGGKDRAAPFIGGDTVWFYYIWGHEEGISTICSAGTPTSGGPVLPEGFTHFAPAFVVPMVGEATLKPLGQAGRTLIRVRGNRVFYLNAPIWETADTCPHPADRYAPPMQVIDFSAWLPSPGTVTAQILIDAELVAGAMNGSGGMAGLIPSAAPPSIPGAGPIANMSVYSPEPYRPAAQVMVTEVPIEASGNFYSVWSHISGSVTSYQAVYFLQGYSFSNG